MLCNCLWFLSNIFCKLIQNNKFYTKFVIFVILYCLTCDHCYMIQPMMRIYDIPDDTFESDEDSSDDDDEESGDSDESD